MLLNTLAKLNTKALKESIKYLEKITQVFITQK